MSGGEGALAFSPSRLPKDEPKSAVDAELNRLEVYPGKVGDSLTLKSHKVTLTREQKAELQRLTGETIYEGLAGLFDSPEYKEMSDELRQQIATKLIDKARTAAREQFIGSNVERFTFEGKK